MQKKNSYPFFSSYAKMGNDYLILHSLALFWLEVPVKNDYHFVVIQISFFFVGYFDKIHKKKCNEHMRTMDMGFPSQKKSNVSLNLKWRNIIVGCFKSTYHFLHPEIGIFFPAAEGTTSLLPEV